MLLSFPSRGFYWISLLSAVGGGDWRPAFFDGVGWTLAGSEAYVAEGRIEQIGGPVLRVEALKLKPGDILLVNLAPGDEVGYASAFLTDLLMKCGLNNQLLVLHGGRSAEVLSDEKLAELGIRRQSWRDQPPLL